MAASSGTMRSLRPLPSTRSLSLSRFRRIAGGQAQRLADAETRPVEQQQNRGIAKALPVVVVEVADRGNALQGLGCRQGLGHCLRQLRSAQIGDRAVVEPAGPAAPAVEAAQRRERARAVELRARPLKVRRASQARKSACRRPRRSSRLGRCPR